MIQKQVVTDVVTELLTKAKAKDWARIEETADDTLIEELIIAVRKSVENYCDIAIGSQTLQVYQDRLPDDKQIVLPNAPHTAITEVVAIDSERTETALTLNSDYYYHGMTDYTVEIATTFLTNTLVQTNDYAYKVKYTCGYTSANVPQALLKAMARIVARHYEMRGDDMEQEVFLDGLDKSLLNPYKRRIWI